MQDSASLARLFSRREPGHTVLAVSGELDLATTSALHDRMVNVLKETTTPLIIDLSGVSFCDATGLALLVGVKRRAKLRGLTVLLAGPRRNVSKLLRITGLDHAFATYPSLTTAKLGIRRVGRFPVA
jgi:anti-anti-sigma factor